MGVSRDWHLVMYDIRDPARYRKAYKVIRGYGARVQYSVFRVRGTNRQIEQLRWELERILEVEDDVLIVPICDSCADRMKYRNPENAWPQEDPSFAILGFDD